MIRSVILALLIASTALAQEFQVTLRVDHVQGAAALRGATAHCHALLVGNGLLGQVTQLVVQGKTYRLDKPVELPLIGLKVDARGIRGRSTTDKADIALVGKPAGSNGYALTVGGLVYARPASQYVQAFLASGTAVYLGEGQPGEPQPVPSAYQWDAKKMTLAGVDRDWPDLNPAELCEAAVAAGMTGVSIELVADDRFIDNPAGAAMPYTALLHECRARNLVLFVSLVNDWINPAKYGAADTLLATVLRAGPAGVIVQPVAETHTAKGSAFESKAFTALEAAGFKTCYNGNGGRPSRRPSGYEYAAWHSGGANDASTAPAGYLEITDHGEKIRWIGYFNVDRVRALAVNARKRGCGFGLYRYVGMGDNGSPDRLPVSASVPSWRAISAVYGVSGVVTQAPSAGTDARTVVGAKLLGPHKSKAVPERARQSKRLFSAELRGSQDIKLSYETLGWPDNNSGIGDNIDGRVLFFWEEGGELVGGHYEWKRPGQTVRGLKNVHDGYLDGRRPPGGARVYVCLMSNDGKERTNLVLAGTWPE